jgi:hypothetical protein
MTTNPLHTYLNDHLAGSVAALELLDHLRESGTPDSEFLTTLRAEIVADQQVLQDLLRAVGGEESRVRQAGAWVTAKLGELKLRVDDPRGIGLRYLQALETLTLGIQGKLALWTALEALRDGVAEINALDLPRLKQRARDQHAMVEARRVAAARSGLAAP